MKCTVKGASGSQTRPTPACTLTAFGAGTQAFRGRLSFWFLDAALPESAPGEAER